MNDDDDVVESDNVDGVDESVAVNTEACQLKIRNSCL